MTARLRIALSKGRILDETLPLLKSTGIELLEEPSKSRKLIFPTSNPNVDIVIIRATDVPTFVEHGAADVGVAGKDVLMEHGARGVYEPLDLNISRCKLMVAAKKAAPRRLPISAFLPRAAAPKTVKGGMTWKSSCRKPRNGAGSSGVGKPSIAPRTGSRRVSTHSASSSPGMPTARKAACQPTRPSGPPPG